MFRTDKTQHGGFFSCYHPLRHMWHRNALEETSICSNILSNGNLNEMPMALFRMISELPADRRVWLFCLYPYPTPNSHPYPPPNLGTCCPLLVYSLVLWGPACSASWLQLLLHSSKLSLTLSWLTPSKLTFPGNQRVLSPTPAFFSSLEVLQLGTHWWLSPTALLPVFPLRMADTRRWTLVSFLFLDDAFPEPTLVRMCPARGGPSANISWMDKFRQMRREKYMPRWFPLKTRNER